VTLEIRDGFCSSPRIPRRCCTRSRRSTTASRRGVGKYNEFENLRIAGIRHADIKGYSYSRGDVTAKALANAYSQALGNIFTQDIKPFEVEVLVAEVAEANGSRNEIYHILYDGTIEDEHNYAAMGGQADEIGASSRTTTGMRSPWTRRCSLGCARSRSPRTRRSASATSRWRAGPQQGAAQVPADPARGAQPTAGHTEVGRARLRPDESAASSALRTSMA